MIQPSEDTHTYSVVVPVFDSEGTLEELYQRLTNVMAELLGADGRYELVFVDDASPGRTWLILQELVSRDSRVRAIQLMKNSGQGLATICGLQAAVGARIITLDDDLQHPPEEIPVLVRYLDEHPECDVVMGVPREGQYSWWRRLGSRARNRMTTVILNKPSDLKFSGFRLMTSAVTSSFGGVRLPYPAVGPLLLRVTDRVVSLETEHHPRKVGKSGYSIRKLLRQMMGNIIGFSVLPLQFLATIGLLGLISSLGYVIYLLVRHMAGGSNLPGFTTQALLMTSMFGLSFFAFGVIGEYLVRILNSTATTPPFVVRSDIRSTSLLSHEDGSGTLETPSRKIINGPDSN